MFYFSNELHSLIAYVLRARSELQVRDFDKYGYFTWFYKGNILFRNITKKIKIGRL